MSLSDSEIVRRAKEALASDSPPFFLCAMCERYHEGRARGLDGCGLKMGFECGSPGVDMQFDAYKGPLSKLHRARHCFVCGKITDQMVTVVKPGEAEKPVALCVEHYEEMLKRATEHRDATGDRSTAWRRRKSKFGV